MTFSWTPYASLSSGDVKKGIRHESSCPRSHRRTRFGAGGVRANTPLEQSRLRQGKDEVGSEGWSGQERRMRCCGACEDRRQKVTTAASPKRTVCKQARRLPLSVPALAPMSASGPFFMQTCDRTSLFWATRSRTYNDASISIACSRHKALQLAYLNASWLLPDLICKLLKTCGVDEPQSIRRALLDKMCSFEFNKGLG